tara:strand:- start:42 stop:1343 length:1302 start_codon:yes stop_codon:yes gene_type:complete
MVGGVSGFNVGATHTWTADQTFNDSVKVTLGTGGDADLYYDGTNVVLTPDIVGSGYISLDGGVVVAAGHTMGIGEASPDTTLHVNGAYDGDNGNAKLQSNNNDASLLTFWNKDSSPHAASRRWKIAANNTANGTLELAYGTSSTGVPTTVAMAIISSGKVGVGTAAPNVKFHAEETTDNPTMDVTSTHASFSAISARISVTRAATTAYEHSKFYSGGFSDVEFNFRGDGEAYADGSWNASGADYQEYFQSNDDAEIETGITVVLDGDKVRAYNALTDTTEDIVGVKRPQADNKNSAVIGNTAWNHWTDKYLTDDWGVYLREDNVIWTYTITDKESQDYGQEVAVYEWRELAKDAEWVAPKGAVSSTQSERKLNPAYTGPLDKVDPDYVPREDRDEWNLIGLLGQIQIKAGEATNPRWKKMKDISAGVQLWYVR